MPFNVIGQDLARANSTLLGSCNEQQHLFKTISTKTEHYNLHEGRGYCRAFVSAWLTSSGQIIRLNGHFIFHLFYLNH